MKLRDLFESEVPAQDVDAIVALIKKDCQPFLSQLDGAPMYRGLRRKAGAHNEDFLKKEVRIDRQPHLTRTENHEIIDGWMQRTFGINGRSATIFCSGDDTTAYTYGNVYAIFPIGKFEFLWSPQIDDLFTDFPRDLEDGDEDGIEEFLENQNYTDKNLAAAIKSSNEIMIQCEEYYALPMFAEDWNSKEVLEKLNLKS